MGSGDVAGFERHVSGPVTVWCRPEDAAALRALGWFGRELGLERGERLGGGRGHAWRIAFGPERGAVLRAYRRGGVLRHLVRALYLSADRALDELRLHEALAARGIAVPRVLAARSERVAGLCWRHWLLTEAVAGDDLLVTLARHPARAREVLAATGAAVARLHQVGFAHADLHPRNLLVELLPRACRVVVLDLDRGRLLPELPAPWRDRSLVRCARYVARHERDQGVRLSARACLRFLRGYHHGDRAAARASWTRLRPQLLRALRLRATSPAP